MKLCNGGNEIYGVDEQGTLKYRHCHLDDERKSMKGGGLSFPDFLLVRYEIPKEMVYLRASKSQVGGYLITSNRKNTSIGARDTRIGRGNKQKADSQDPLRQRGDGVACIKRRRRDLSSDGIRDLVTASGRGQLNEDLESSTW
ncbi:hypothetical protein Tco_0629864 [Tanacetum coccineum]|uniref:Uncharacterized protein n=1 Tax=Tanacetum coccineum TaxID=301880 RepID=A0ABQ4WUD9_9ASTR